MQGGVFKTSSVVLEKDSFGPLWTDGHRSPYLAQPDVSSSLVWCDEAVQGRTPAAARELCGILAMRSVDTDVDRAGKVGAAEVVSSCKVFAPVIRCSGLTPNEKEKCGTTPRTALHSG